jgi:orotidine-5'-phosphate decarboxylase
MDSIASRLIAAADFDVPEARDFPLEMMFPSGASVTEFLLQKTRAFAEPLAGTGVCIKMNSALRMIGARAFDLLDEIGVKAFADFKLNDIPATMRLDAKWLSFVRPEIVTVMCSSDIAGMKAFKEATHPDIKVIGVTVLTTFDDDQSIRTYGRPVVQAVTDFADSALEAGIDGIVCSPQELEILSKYERFEKLRKIVPGVRPSWYKDDKDDQKRVMTPEEAMYLGADYLVVGRPVTKSNFHGQPQSPKDAVARIVAGMEQGICRRLNPKGDDICMS